MPRQYLIPGSVFVNEDDTLREFLIPGTVFVNESGVSAPPPPPPPTASGFGSQYQMYLGDYAVNSLVDHKWNAQGAGANIRVYKNNSTTERSTSAGITDVNDFDGLTGVNHLRINLGDNTDPAFYTAGSEYHIVLQGATIDGNLVNVVLAHFSIERAGGPLALLKSASFGLAAIKNDTVNVDLAALSIKDDTVAIKDVTDTIGLSGVDVNVVSWNGVAVSPSDSAGYPVVTVKDGTGPGELQLTAGAVDLSTAALAAVNAEVVDTLNVDTYAESGIPAATSSLAAKIRWLATIARNKILQTGTTQRVRNDADSADLSTSTVSDDGTTFTRGKWT
jgi:hypothetical protein